MRSPLNRKFTTPSSRSALLKEVEEKEWCRPGDGDFYHYLEEYAFYYDHKFHKIDAYNARGRATIVPLPVRTPSTLVTTP